MAPSTNYGAPPTRQAISPICTLFGRAPCVQLHGRRPLRMRESDCTELLRACPLTFPARHPWALHRCRDGSLDYQPCSHKTEAGELRDERGWAWCLHAVTRPQQHLSQHVLIRSNHSTPNYCAIAQAAPCRDSCDVNIPGTCSVPMREAERSCRPREMAISTAPPPGTSRGSNITFRATPIASCRLRSTWTATALDTR